jgi:modified peptide precursor CbpA
MQKGVIRSKQKKSRKSVIAIRKTCQAKGIGLSHYVMMESKKK